MKIILKPHSGLANRIRVMVSGVSLAKKLHCPLEIVWETDKGLNCDFYDLFRPHHFLNVRSKNRRSDLISNFRAKPVVLSALKFFLGVGFVMHDKDMKDFVWSTGTDYIDLSKLRGVSGDIYIKCANEFYFESDNLQYFLPTAEIQQLIDDNTKKFTGSTIGIHIRRTDHKLSIRESPLEIFKAKMLIEVNEHEHVSFYLATDDPEVRAELKREFGERLFYADAVLNRTTTEGMRHAMLDLFSLAKTCKIYGSFGSSYSDVASRIGKIPLIVVQGE